MTKDLVHEALYQDEVALRAGGSVGLLGGVRRSELGGDGQRLC